MVSDSVAVDRLSDLQKMEAQWVCHEMEDFVRLIERYRGIYVTAIFISVGWVLSQILAAVAPGGASTGLQAGTVAAPTLDSLRHRADVATLLCVIPLVNVLFVILILEANAHLQSLARYRFLLGMELNGGEPAWRSELWQATREGSIRPWRNTSDVFFSLVAVALTVAALWFAAPAAWQSRGLWWAWLASLAFPVALVVVVTIIGIMRIDGNEVADPATTRWCDLRPERKKRSLVERLLLRGWLVR